MSRTIPSPEWLGRPVARGVTQAFAKADLPLRFVGGAVRDHLLGRPVLDIDAATTATPDQTIALLKRQGLKAVPTGLAHGTVTAVLGGETLEITTLRRDVDTDGRHAVIAFTDDWREDAARRDFTLNALYLSPEGQLYDYFGGQADLAQGHIRFIGAPSERIAEDYLRILRYFRFLATHGRQPADVTALAACETASLELLHLSGERIRQEMLKLLAAPNPLYALEAMQTCGVLSVLTGHAFDIASLRPLLVLEAELDEREQMPHPLVRLARLLRTTAKADTLARDLAARWRFSAREAKLLATLCAATPPSALDLPAAHRLAYQYGNDWAALLVLLHASEGATDGAAFDQLYVEAAEWPIPRLPVGGEDLQALGLRSGPALGKALRMLEQRWIDSDFTLNREALLQELTNSS